MNNFVVNETCKNIRGLARQALRGNWVIAIATALLSVMLVSLPALLIEMFMEGETGFEIFLLNVESLLIGAPITLGLSLFMLSLFRGDDPRIGRIFEGFEYFIKAVALRLVISVFVILWTFCLIIPGIIAAIKYSQAFYILADDPSKGIMQCIDESKWMMKDNKLKYFSLILSFFGWAILAAIPFGLGYLWLVPYVNMAQVAFYELVSGNLRPDVLEEISNE